MTPACDLRQLLDHIDEHGPSTARGASKVLPHDARRLAADRLKAAAREGLVVGEASPRGGPAVYALTPAGVAWLEAQDAARAGEGALARALARASETSLRRRESGRDTHLRLTPGELVAFADRLREAVARGGVCLSRLAREAGLTQPAFNYYLGGRGAPKAGTLVDLARALGCSADWLAAASDDPAWRRPAAEGRAA